MKKLLTQTATLIALLLCMVTTSACFDDEEDTRDPQAENYLVGVWQGHSTALGEWRIDFRKDRTARVTQYTIDSDHTEILILQDLLYNDWGANNNEFYIGNYYEGKIQPDGSITLNTRLVGTDGEVIYVTLRKATVDNFPDLIEHQNTVYKLIGSWEGLSDDGTYARRLELERDNGVLTGKGATYYASGTKNISTYWEVAHDTVTFTNQYFSFVFNTQDYELPDEEDMQLQKEQGTLLNDSTLRLPGVTLKKLPEPVVNLTQTVQKAIGTWVDAEGNRMTLNEDMTASHSLYNPYGNATWQTTGEGEVQFLTTGRDYLEQVRRFIFVGDDLVCYPALSDSPKYVKQN